MQFQIHWYTQNNAHLEADTRAYKYRATTITTPNGQAHAAPEKNTEKSKTHTHTPETEKLQQTPEMQAGRPGYLCVKG